jgi:ubiquinone/menaquinone biosynthesis C-methylase UbiE
MEQAQYVIRGGIEGRERLRLLSRILQPTTLALLLRAGARPGMICLEAGSGGGDVAFELARIVGPNGKVVGVDFDEKKVEIARGEAEAAQLKTVEFHVADLTKHEHAQEFDLIHARFLLTHLPNPEAVLAKMYEALRSGGAIIIEDIDFDGYFCYPECAAVRRYVELYKAVVRFHAADPCIGPRLPSLLADAGFKHVQMNIVQPAGTSGEVKLLSPLTMENIAGSVVAAGLASQAEVDQIIAEMYDYANTPGTVGCGPRIVEAWGWKER